MMLVRVYMGKGSMAEKILRAVLVQHPGWWEAAELLDQTAEIKRRLSASRGA